MHMQPKQDLIAKAAVLLLVGGVAFVGISRMRPDAPLHVEALSTKTAVVENLPPPSSPTPTVAPANTMVVDVAGEVVHRGVVTLPANARAGDAIKAAGGMKPTADADAVNLAAKLVDGDQVYVPPKGQRMPPVEKRSRTARGSRKSRSTKVVLPKVDLPKEDLVASAAPTPPRRPPEDHSEDFVYHDPRKEVEVLPSSPYDKPKWEPIRRAGSSTESSAPKSWSTSDQVDLNRCVENDLLRVPGIGPVTAQKIIAFRNLKGRIVSLNDLLRIPGIGPKKLEKMKPYLRL